MINKDFLNSGKLSILLCYFNNIISLILHFTLCFLLSFSSRNSSQVLVLQILLFIAVLYNVLIIDYLYLSANHVDKLLFLDIIKSNFICFLFFWVNFSRRKMIKREFSSLPVNQNQLWCGFHVGLSSFFQLSFSDCHFLKEILGILPLFNSVRFDQMSLINFLYDLGDVICRIEDFLGPYTAFQNTIDIAFSLGYMYSPRTIDQIYSFGQCNILPNSCFSGNWCCFTYYFFFQRIDDTRFTYVRVSYEANADILFISMENIKLTKQVY